MDWSDEAKARLEEEEKRLRLKAANLQERHGAWSLMAKQELVVANDISAALEEIEQRGERLAQWEREEVTRAANCCGQEERAEAAEANAALLDQAATDYRKSRDVAEAKLAVCVEALRECQRVFDHPAFTDRAGIGDVCRVALAAAKGGE